MTSLANDRPVSSPQALCAQEDTDIEWWYYCGHLWSQARPFGFHLVFFRTSRGGRRFWVPATLWRPLAYYAHFALSDVAAGQFRYAHRRASRRTAGAARQRFQVWLEDWSVEDAGDRHRLTATMKDVHLNLSLVAVKPPVYHHDQLFYQKDGDVLHRWYWPRLQATGQLAIGGTNHDVTGCTWLGREFGSWILGGLTKRWDWVAVQLTDGPELEVRVLWDRQQQMTAASTVMLVANDGSTQRFSAAAFHWQPLAKWTSPATGTTYPNGWRLQVPQLALDLEIVPVLDFQELDTPGSTMQAYWEGAATARGHMAGLPIAGPAYVELAGYGRPGWPSLANCLTGEFLYQLGRNEQVVGPGPMDTGG